MSTTIDWGTKVISVLRADMLLVQSVPTEIRELDLDTFRLELKDLEDDDGMPFLDTHNHNGPVTVGGVTLARVLEIINGYTVTFEDGQYAVNLSGANSNVGDVTNVNQVSIRSANSAGLTYSKEIEDQSFTASRVWVNTITGLPGTQFPRGTPGDPVDNLNDAIAIIEARNLPKRIHLRGSVVVGSADSIADFDIEGASARLAEIEVMPDGVTTNLVVSSLSMTGDLNGNIQASNSTSLFSLQDFDGKLSQCGLAGEITMGTGGIEHDFIDCYSEVSGTSKPMMNCQDLVSLDVSFRRYSGGLEVSNFSDASNNMSIDLDAGSVVLDSTCTAGTIVVRGVGTLVDNSGPGCIVVSNGLITGSEMTEVWQKHGLDPDNALSITDTSIDFDTTSIDVSDDGTTTTVTRQP